jgi:alpha-tubulin suppressor-like RCC1 family protein
MVAFEEREDRVRTLRRHDQTDAASGGWPTGQSPSARMAPLVVLLAFLGGSSPTSANTVSPGQLYAFGDNQHGELGNPTNNMDLEGVRPNPTPALVEMPDEIGSVAQAATGGGFSLAITSSGQLYAFGDNYFGQLGSPTNNQDIFAANPTPTLVSLPSEAGHAVQAAGGTDHSLVVTSSGQLYAFGENWFGQLGNTTNNQTEEPNPTPTLVTLPGATGPVIQAAAGFAHSLALTSTGQLYSFGSNRYGQLGTTTDLRGFYPAPDVVTLPEENGPVTQIAAGAFFSLAVTSSGQLYAFGENRFGQLGSTTNSTTGEPNPEPTLVTLPGATGPVIQAAAGESHSLALTSTGQLYAFGSDSLGELGKPPGSEPSAPHPTPSQVVLPDNTNVETIATGLCDHTLAVVADLSASTASLPAGEIGAPYKAQAGGSGGINPYTWTATGLPQGLLIDRTSGAISGTPTKPGVYTPTITVTDSHRIEASSEPSISIRAPNEPPPTEQPPPPSETPPPIQPPTPPPAIERTQPPVLQNVHQSSTRWRKGNSLAHASHGRLLPIGTVFSFLLNEQASVSFRFIELYRSHDRKCLAKQLTSVYRKSCTHAIRRGTLAVPGHSGINAVNFVGRISRFSALRQGRYGVIISAVNLAGQRSRLTLLQFTIAD